MDFEFLQKNFSNYTLAMWEGNEPQKRLQSVDNDWFYVYNDHLHNCSCEIYHGDIVIGDIKILDYTIFVCDYRYSNGGYKLDILYNNGENYWVYSNKNGECSLSYNSTKRKPYISEEKLRKIIYAGIKRPTVAPIFIMRKARELFELGDWKGEYRDL